jgi:hypothetical protein
MGQRRAGGRGHPPRELFLFGRSVGHHTFLDLCTPAGRRALENYCPTRDSVQGHAHDETIRLESDFFQRTL